MKKVRLVSRFTGISFTLVMLLMVGCSEMEGPIPAASESSDATLKGANKLDGVYELVGTTHFPSYAVKEHRVVSPYEMNMLGCLATLSIDGKNFTLETEEYLGPMLLRTVTFTGQITPGGTLKFSWPDTWWQTDGEKSIEGLLDTYLLHTGCIPYGPGYDGGRFDLNYKGKFDGSTFYASVHFMAKQVQFGEILFYSETMLGSLVEGPVQFEFSIELETVSP
jgi:hypothetical protein